MGFSGAGSGFACLAARSAGRSVDLRRSEGAVEGEARSAVEARGRSSSSLDGVRVADGEVRGGGEGGGEGGGGGLLVEGAAASAPRKTRLPMAQPAVPLSQRNSTRAKSPTETAPATVGALIVTWAAAT